MQKIIKNIALFFLIASWFSSAYADTTEILNKTLPISSFMIDNKPIALHGSSDSYEISIPVSDRITPLSLDLNLQLYNSNKLKQERSQLIVSINDYFVQQISLDPLNFSQQVKISIAGEYLINGYNRLTFKVAQHYTIEQCEDGSAPELWTQIDTVKTTVSLKYNYQNVTTSLAQLDKLINKRLTDYKISFLRPQKKLSDDYLYWGAIAAQGVKLRLNYAPMQLEEMIVEPYKAPAGTPLVKTNFSINPVLLKHDAVLLGTKEQLQNLVAPEILTQISGAYLGLFQQDANKQNFILVMSGLNPEQVNQAVKAFSLMNFSLPDAQQTIIKAMNFPPENDLLPSKTILSGASYTFSQLGFKNVQLQEQNHSTKLEIKLPPDMYSTEEAQVVLHLNLAYGAAMRKDSVINLSLNGLFNHAIQLKENDSGAHYKDYQIKIPLRDFKAGLNTLEFDAVLNPSEYGKCTRIQGENLKVTLYENSIISFPETGQAATLPDLSLFGKTGYPFVKAGSAANTYVELLDESSDTVQSAWHLVAWLASFSHTPVFDIQIGQTKQAGNRANILRIGKKYSAPDFFVNAPVKLGQQNQFSYSYKELQSKLEESWLRTFERQFFDKSIEQQTNTSELKHVGLIQSGDLGEQFLLMSYPSEVKGGVALAVLSKEKNSIYTGLQTLFSQSLLWELQGDTFVWNTQKQFFATRNGNAFVVGDRNTSLNLMMHFSIYPWQWLLVVFTVIVLLAWIIRNLLIKFKARTHEGVEDENVE